MNKTIKNYLMIFSGLFTLVVMKAPTDALRVAEDMAAFVSPAIAAHFGECHAPGGINEQVAQNGNVGTWQRGIDAYDDGSGHYATNNRHQANNRYHPNGIPKPQPTYKEYEVYEGNSSGGFSTKPILFILLILVGLGWYRSQGGGVGE